MKAILLSYLAIFWIGLGIYMARYYWRRYHADPSIRWQLPLMIGQGLIWAFGVYGFGREILRAAG